MKFIRVLKANNEITYYNKLKNKFSKHPDFSMGEMRSYTGRSHQWVAYLKDNDCWISVFAQKVSKKKDEFDENGNPLIIFDIVIRDWSNHEQNKDLIRNYVKDFDNKYQYITEVNFDKLVNDLKFVLEKIKEVDE